MSPDKYFDLFEEKYRDDFNWMCISSDSFVEELRQKLEDKRSLNPITAIAKCELNDDVLFQMDGIYRIYHLTYVRKADSLRCLEFKNLSEAMDYIEKDYVENYFQSASESK